MNAYVFVLEGQSDIYKEISTHLRNRIYNGIDIHRVDIDPNYSIHSRPQVHESCRQYLKFLRASLLTSGHFEVVVKDKRDTHWCYLGYTAIAGSYCFELKHEQLSALFPAVAILDRIVLLPAKFTRNLDVHPRSFLSLPRPLAVGGVELVDFHAKGALSHAFERVDGQLRRECLGLCHRHMSVRHLLVPDFEELGLLLNVDPAFLESKNTVANDVRLDVSVVEGGSGPVEGQTGRITLELRNVGGRALRNIRVQVQGPANVLKPALAEICNLLPPEAVRLEVEMTPPTAPCCPLEVFVDQGDDPTAVPAGPIPVLVNVRSRATEQQGG
jgi:hypothetical protein